MVVGLRNSDKTGVPTIHIMAPGIGLGFLVGSLLILGVVLYYTRVKNPVVPRAGTDEADGEISGTQSCELCERRRVCREVGDLMVCAECNDDLMT
jgi:hypothetical protein